MKLKNVILSCLSALLLPFAAVAQDFDNVLSASLLTGWRQSNGTHMAAIRIDLEPGWHTYWRAPGDAGIPPIFDLTGSGNLKSARVIWPRPEVYTQNGLRSIVYHDQVVLPLEVHPRSLGKDIQLTAKIDIGVCKEICIPKSLTVQATLPAAASQRDTRIAAALADRPFSGRDAGASNVTCSLTPSSEGVSLTTSFTLPRVGRSEAVVIETANPLLWIAEPALVRSGNSVTATTEIQHVEGASFAIKRQGIRITMFGENRAVEIIGCSGK